MEGTLFSISWCLNPLLAFHSFPLFEELILHVSQDSTMATLAILASCFYVCVGVCVLLHPDREFFSFLVLSDAEKLTSDMNNKRGRLDTQT